MQSLDPTLAAAMESIDRRPIVKIVSAPMVGDIPFAGIPQAPLPQKEGTWYGAPYVGYEEYNPMAIPLSSGEAAYVSIYGYKLPTAGAYIENRQIKLVTTTGGRTAFNLPVVLDLIDPSAESAQYLQPPETLVAELSDSNVSVVELANGNLGLTWLRAYGSGGEWRIGYHAAEINSAGEIVYPTPYLWAPDSLKEYYSEFTFNYWSGPSTIRLASGSYLSVFVHKFGGTNYTIWKKTSSDFRTWAARSEVTLPGLDLTKQISSVSLSQLSNGDVMMLFDYTESVGGVDARLRNVYYSVSSDDGATWAAPVKITDYSDFSTVGMHPVAVQTAPGELTLVFTELVSVLTMNQDTLGWDGGQLGKALSFDPVNRKLYVVNFANGGDLQGVVKVDVDTWTVDKTWTNSSVPAFPAADWRWRDREKRWAPDCANSIWRDRRPGREADSIKELPVR
jgi:hypothetical protein